MNRNGYMVTKLVITINNKDHMLKKNKRGYIGHWNWNCDWENGWLDRNLVGLVNNIRMLVKTEE